VRVVRRGPLVVHARPEPGGVPGWMIVAPERHVESLEGLTSTEQAALLPLVVEVAAALRAETACEKTYTAVFSEVLPHLHVHVIARPPGLADAFRGPGVFAAPPVSAEEAEGVSERVLRHLLRTSSPPGPRAKDPALRAALLSALVCPGAGQIKNRQYAKGLALVGLTLATAGLLLVRMLTEILRLLPKDGSVIDPMAAWDMASEIQARNQGTFHALSFALVVLWVYGTVDAWFGAKRAQR
jgi:diadenosine tetraphosphate (Ap4A) HIT family hydrolase